MYQCGLSIKLIVDLMPQKVHIYCDSTTYLVFYLLAGSQNTKTEMGVLQYVTIDPTF